MKTITALLIDSVHADASVSTVLHVGDIHSGSQPCTSAGLLPTLASGDPLKELASVRELFFSRPGRTLGGTDKRVTSQALAFDPAWPADAQYVENVMWEDQRVVFVTLNAGGAQPHAHHGAGLDQRAGRMAAPDDRPAQRRPVQLEQRALPRQPHRPLPVGEERIATPG